MGLTMQKQYRDLKSVRVPNLLHTRLVSTVSFNLQRMAEQINKLSGLAAELTSVNMLGKVKNLVYPFNNFEIVCVSSSKKGKIS